METTTPFKIEHNGVTITYDEPRNLFCFELRGRQRTAESLMKAREAIDKPVKEKAKPFERFKAWWNGGRWGSGGWKVVEVTSIAEARYGETEVWIVIPADTSERRWRSSPTRQKTSADCIFPCNEKNDPLVAQMQDLHKQADALEKQATKIKEGLKPYVIPKE